MTLLPDPVPAGPPDLRIADSDRQRVVEFLRFHCAEGRLTLDEFSDRVGDAYAARTAAELARAVGDLPIAPDPAAPGPAVAVPEAGPPAPSPGRARRAVRWTFSVMGGHQQRGRWRIEGETTAVSFMGGCQLDLRQAEVEGSEIVINAISFMGGIDIVVPEGIAVTLEGFSFMGGRNMKLADVPVLPGSPLVRVRAFAFMGGVNVRSKPLSSGRRSRARNQSGPDRPDRVARAADRAQRKLDQAQRKLDRELGPSAPRIDEVLGQLADGIGGSSRPPRREPAAHPRRPHGGRRPAPRGTSAGRPEAVPPAFGGVAALAGSVAAQWRELRSRVAPEGTVTIMFSDIEGFTGIMERLGDHRAALLLQEHHRIVRQAIEEHRGFEVKNQGDGFMIAFDSAARALRCAIAIQQRLKDWDGGMDEPVRVRIGLHTGEAIRDADDFLGTTVNVAARIADAANGGEILVSGLLRELCTASGEFHFDGGDEVELKGLSRPQRLWTVRWS